MDGISVADLRAMVADAIYESIEEHRDSRENLSNKYIRPHGPPSEDEIDDFIRSHASIDKSADGLLRMCLMNGRSSNFRVYGVDTEEFQLDCRVCSKESEWLNAILPLAINPEDIKPGKSQIWTPENDITPQWIKQSPTYLLIAFELLQKGRLLSEMSWRAFEQLLGCLLEREGWEVKVMRGTKDGGIDVISERVSEVTGIVKALWQAKKYDIGNKVRLSQVRELSGVLNRSGATKAIIVTTSHLTKDAIEWVRQDQYRMAAKQKEDIEYWVRKSVLGEYE